MIVPDVLLQPHNASLEMTFYDGNAISARAIAAISSRPSMARGTGPDRTGYEVIRVPMNDGTHAETV